MKNKKFFIILFLITFIVCGFFYKTILNGYVPFPGDLLVSEYNPWKTYSFLGYNPGSYPNKAQYFDTLRQLYPWKTLSVDSLKKLNIPLWNPYNFSGAPLLANFQSTVFYPFNFLYFLLPQIWAWSSLIMLQPFLALFFTFLYARKIGISRVGSCFAGISFGFSSFMAVWLEYNTIGHVILWLPLILLSLEKLFGSKTIKWSLFFVFSTVSSLLGGHIQIFGYLFIFILIYIFVRTLSFRNTNLKKNLIFFGILTFLPLGIGAVQLIPGIELISQSARSAHEYASIIHKILIQSWQLVMLVVPDFFGNPATRNYWVSDTYVGDVIYVGLIPLFFILFVIFGKKDFFTKFFLIATIALFILVTLNPLTELLYKINIPIISSSSSNLLVFIICFSMSILGGFGVDTFMKNKYSIKRSLKFLAPLLLIFSFLWLTVFVLPKLHWFGWENNLSTSLRNLLYSTIIFIVALTLLLMAAFNSKTKRIVIVLLLMLSLFDLWRYFQKFNPFSPVEFTFPKTAVLEFIKNNNGINRHWGYGVASIEANFATQNSIFSTDGYDPLYPKRYGEFIQSSGDGKIITKFTGRTRSDAFIVGGYGEKNLIENHSRLKILNMLGVRYVLDRFENGSTQKTFPSDKFSLVYEDSGWKIFENLKVVPRFFLTENYEIFRTKEQFNSIFFDKNFDPSKTILLEENPSSFFRDDEGKVADIKVLSYAPNEVNFAVQTDSNKLFFISDNYYPGWKAFVDGKETKIYRANYAFRSIVVKAGEKNIKFVYDPLSFKVGYIISLVSVLFFVVLLVTIKKRKSDI